MFGTINDFITDNPVKCVIAVAGTVATGGLCWVAAPAVASTLGATGLLGAASTGTTIITLSGTALTNASLAALGGGALTAGGGGMAAGTMVVAGSGSVAAGATSTTAIAASS